MNVIKIAICDDEEKAVALHERIVKACLQSQGIGYEITTYTQSRNLLYDITDDGFFYDLILLESAEWKSRSSLKAFFRMLELSL